MFPQHAIRKRKVNSSQSTTNSEDQPRGKKVPATAGTSKNSAECCEEHRCPKTPRVTEFVCCIKAAKSAEKQEQPGDDCRRTSHKTQMSNAEMPNAEFLTKTEYYCNLENGGSPLEIAIEEISIPEDELNDIEDAGSGDAEHPEVENPDGNSDYRKNPEDVAPPSRQRGHSVSVQASEDAIPGERNTNPESPQVPPQHASNVSSSAVNRRDRPQNVDADVIFEGESHRMSPAVYVQHRYQGPDERESQNRATNPQPADVNRAPTEENLRPRIVPCIFTPVNCAPSSNGFRFQLLNVRHNPTSAREFFSSFPRLNVNDLSFLPQVPCFPSARIDASGSAAVPTRRPGHEVYHYPRRIQMPGMAFDVQYNQHVSNPSNVIPNQGYAHAGNFRLPAEEYNNPLIDMRSMYRDQLHPNEAYDPMYWQ